MVKRFFLVVSFFMVKASSLISRYLYVGLSRATFFMGVTTSSTDIDILPEIIDEFDTTGTWGEE